MLEQQQRKVLFTRVTPKLAWLTIFLVACLFVQLVSCSADNQVKPLKPLRVATGDWAPFVHHQLPHNGPLAKMVSTVLADMGYVPEFRFYDWPMTEIHLKAGYPVIAFPYIESEERKRKGFRFSKPLYNFEYVLFYHYSRATEFSSLRNFKDIVDKNLKIGRIRGYAKLKEISDDASYVEVVSANAGFNQLRTDSKNGKIDFLLESKRVGLNLLNSSVVASDRDVFRFLGQEGHKELVSRESLKIMLSPKLNKAILDSINSSIDKPDNKAFFDSLSQSIGVAEPDIAILTGTAGKAITGYSNISRDESSFTIPHNTRVLVLDWGKGFLMVDGAKPSGMDMSQVKLLDGPLRGKVVWVENRYLTIEH